MTSTAYYTKVVIQPSAMIKMIEHAVSGGENEVMGILFGHVDSESFSVIEVINLPVSGTETRVSADALAEEWLVKFVIQEEANQSRISPLGWYHSHPGYGCWLSNIDLDTHARYQNNQDPWLAIVIDPTNTSCVDIGAFRLAERNFLASFTSFTVDHARARVPSRPYYSIPIEVGNNALTAPAQYKITLNIDDILQHKMDDTTLCELLEAEMKCRLAQ